jgi:putative RecB family exonuclease
VSYVDGRISFVPASRRATQKPAIPEQLGFEGMPEKLFVCTPSKLSAYADCPRRYRFSYIDRPAPQKGPPWAHNSLGASVHTAMKNWYGLEPGRRSTGALPTLLHGTWVGEGYRDDVQEQAAFQRALGWLETYVASLDPRAEPTGVERVVAAKTTTLAFSGRADRIDRRGDELVIVDYKTGRAELTADDARGSSALALYAYAAAKTFRRSCRTVELHHLPTGTIAAHEHSDASIERAVSRAEAIARDIRTASAAMDGGATPDEAFPTSPSTLCSYCDFKRICPAGADAPQKQPWTAVEATLATPQTPR